MKKILSLTLVLVAIATVSFSQVTDTGDKVGIGITTPSAKLHVNGSTIFGDPDSYSTDQHIFYGKHLTKKQSTGGSQNFVWWKDATGSNQAYLGHYTTNTFRLYSYEPILQLGTSSNTLTINSTGFGIGTSSPQTNLHVHASSSGRTPTNVSGLFVENAGSEGDYYVFQTATVGGGKSFSITNDGKVGIGTAVPSSKLDIVGDFRVGNGETSDNTVFINNSGIYQSRFVSYIKNLTGELIIGTELAHKAYIRTNNINRLTVTSTGNIGIGTSSPQTNLHVHASSSGRTPTNVSGLFVENAGSEGDYYVFQTATVGGGKSFSITNDGKVGIGTAVPSSKLDIVGDFRVGNGETSDNTVFINNSGIYQSRFASYIKNLTGELIIGTELAHKAYIRTNNINRLTVTSTGNIGIGTTSPSYKLAVAGTIGCGELKVEDVSGWSDFVFAPDYKLRTLTEVENYIQENNHLPDVPSEAQVKAEGYDVTEMNATLLQKIEELMLYTIEQQKEIEALKAIVNKQENIK